jgi:N-acetylglutamate synthase-like GNAT family acetyltransferase
MIRLTDIEVKRIEHNSPEYKAAVALRYLILRQPLGLTFSDEQLSSEADSYHIGSYLDGKLIACLILKPLDNHQIQIRQVAVDSLFQRSGVGSALVCYSETLAKQLDFKEMILHARETAVPFYERLKYQKAGDRFTEITVPHWLMLKTLR